MDVVYKNPSLRRPDSLIGQEGSSFYGFQWLEAAGAGPVLMCDSYVMTGPTFPMHPHRSISAVAILFEETEGVMHSSDSVGTNHHFGAGDIHWTLAGSGVMHTQTPEPNSKIVAVQIFIDLPKELKNSPAQTFHLEASKAPIYESEGCRIRILAGSAFGFTSPLDVPQDILIIEGWSQSDLTIPVPSGWKVWIYDRDNERAGYSSEPIVGGQFLLVASPLGGNPS